MAQFLVEAYAARANGNDLAQVVGRLHVAAKGLTHEGVPVHYVRSIYIPSDETCFHVFEGPSIEAIEEVGRRAELTFNRVAEAIDPILQGGVT